MLYERDYRKLTDSENVDWKKAEKFLKNSKDKFGGISPEKLLLYYAKLPTAALHYKQLFPNNYLDSFHLANKERLSEIIKEFNSLIDNLATEREILEFIRVKKAYFIIASIFKGFHYNFGHHKAFAFKEFALPPNYLVDFLLVGKSSGGYQFIFIELESTTGQITNNNGEFGSTIRKGIKQINDWDSWLERNYSSLRMVFDKYIGIMEPLPREFLELDKSRLHYVVIAGRRTDFKKETYQIKRKMLKSNNILILHYDNLFDSVEYLLRTGNY